MDTLLVSTAQTFDIEIEHGDLPVPDLTGTGLPLPQPGGLVKAPDGEHEPPEAPAPEPPAHGH